MTSSATRDAFSERKDQKKEGQERLSLEEEQQRRQRELQQQRRAIEQSYEEEQDLGFCHNIIKVSVKAMHVIDVILGILFVTYGIIIHFKQPRGTLEEAVGITVSFGLVLLVSSTIGTIAIWTSLCKRCGMIISAWCGLLIALIEFVIIIALLASHDKFFAYLEKNKDKLSLSTGAINTFRKVLPLIYIVIAVFIFIEVARFFFLRKLRGKMVEKDEYMSSHSQQMRSIEQQERALQREMAPRKNFLGGLFSRSAIPQHVQPDENWYASEPLLGSE
uniref:Uncharacterized protein n=1 Tax=Ditylum brightwellii TaxID=49249 RepID=A0A7S2EKY9_9STRA|mmetsp:Transcript_34639/g.51690  ORF Transcript_34639/g.51690 Transcript_34639/m.51690 type:complete len:276 (+) Transcript_34639:100-927(+)